MHHTYDQNGNINGYVVNGLFYDRYGNYVGMKTNNGFYDRYGNLTMLIRGGNVYDLNGNLLFSDGNGYDQNGNLPSRDGYELDGKLPSGDGYVYVIQDIDTGLYKIGVTNNPERRLKELGVGNSAVLISYDYFQNAREVEKNAHKRYSDYRLPQTEYFKLNQPPSIY